MNSRVSQLSCDRLKDKAKKGATIILSTCLEMGHDQELLIVFDETTRDFAQTILGVAVDMGINPTALYADRRLQEAVCDKGELSLLFEGCIKDSRAILTCLTNEPRYMLFRSRIVSTGMEHRKKVGHIPGAKMSILRTAMNADYDEIVRLCDLLAIVLVKGNRIELTTRDRKGKEYHLRADIGGWDRMPVNSTGIIPSGAWGNIPGGETYISPIEGTGQGRIVIDGSVPGRVLRKGQEILLNFEKGKMTTAEIHDDACREFFDQFRTLAVEKKDENWSNLAEIGIGVNKRLGKLTGNPIVDEKKYGTAHIALGNSHGFGGSVSSSLHLDMITKSPVVNIDGIDILKCSKLIVDGVRLTEKPHQLQADGDKSLTPEQVGRTRVDTRLRRGRFLQRKWISGAGRENWMDLGDQDTAETSAKVYRRIPPGRTIDVTELEVRLDIEKETLLRILQVLKYYGVVDLA